MITYIKKRQTNLSYRILSTFVAIAFFTMIVPPGYGSTELSTRAQSVLNLPPPGVMISTSPTFNPPIITGITLYPDNPLQFDFLIDIGDNQLEGNELKQESKKLINYFMAALTVPEDEMLVNLSPYEKRPNHRGWLVCD